MECFEIWFKDSHNTNLKNLQGEFRFSKWISRNSLWRTAYRQNFDLQTWQTNCKAADKNIEKIPTRYEDQPLRI